MLRSNLRLHVKGRPNSTIESYLTASYKLTRKDQNLQVIYQKDRITIGIKCFNNMLKLKMVVQD